MTRPIAFVDTETTGLGPAIHDVWEIAVIRRADGVDAEHLWQIRLDAQQLEKADPEALRINRYHERVAAIDPRFGAADMTHPCGMPHLVHYPGMVDALHAALADAVLVGSNPAFDAAFLKALLARAGATETPWHYRPVDVATLAAGHLIGAGRSAEVTVPYSSRSLSRALGVEPPGHDAHTALADARWARDLYDAATGTTTR
ncbi:3'-5' exonuclease [Streptomyces sp. XM4011]|uniref:3'-5' exonuclease n=1 Tax=Streptomyces sp. XM4011 TaxID=2929780 RepID=UPI001FFBE9E2|nr:3'-5' exonuclease [Streptomyces sp. XM4011]MCK1813309.1 3'-5' exonuclease [Streptomyces sp. XM4011]